VALTWALCESRRESAAAGSAAPIPRAADNARGTPNPKKATA
jgi:heme a synthase